jgi:hypothetical protein
MKMIHTGCGGEIDVEEQTPFSYHVCKKCHAKIPGDSRIQLIPESGNDQIQLEALEEALKLPPTIFCSNCDWAGLGFFPISRRLWNAWFLCNDCGRVMRITAIITAIVMTIVGWFY